MAMTQTATAITLARIEQLYERYAQDLYRVRCYQRLLYTDRFDTDRWLARGRLTGDFRHGNSLFSPHSGVIYFEEDQLNG